jgi:stage II sporulation protein E
MDYESAANIINDALEEDDGEYRFDHALEQRIVEYLSDAGVRTQSVTVYGKRRRQILVRGVDVEHATVSVETMRADLGEMCGMELSCPIFEIEDNVSLMTFRARKKISVISAESNLSADGGVSGDSVNLFSNKKDFFYALICDGMGAGREAALTSGLCSVFLEKMLRAGNRAGTSLRMLNNMTRSRGADSTRECSSTVDLLELDLMTAKASFTKSGASPSFVIRDRVVHRLQAGTAPIGIICALDVQSTPFDLRVGDTVVMVSDGVLQDDPECEWLSRFLVDAATLTPEELVYHISLHAAKNERHDDCSALAIRICGVEEE